MAGRLRRLAVALPVGTALGFVILLATSTGLTTVRGGRIGGDLPAFYGAARIVASGNVDRLYDAASQEAAEADLFPGGTRGRLPFPYPPFVAFAYIPLTWLPFKAAYAVHTLVMALCVFAAVRILRRALPEMPAGVWPVFGVTLAFYPLFRAVLGGQNTALSLLCAAGAAAAVARGRGLEAGLWAGAWLYKPQLALPVAGALLLTVDD